MRARGVSGCEERRTTVNHVPCVRACVRACKRDVKVGVRACECVSLFACVPACVRACVRFGHNLTCLFLAQTLGNTTVLAPALECRTARGAVSGWERCFSTPGRTRFPHRCVDVDSHAISLDPVLVCGIELGIDVSTCQRFNVSTFQRFQRFNVSTFSTFSTFQRFNVSTFRARTFKVLVYSIEDVETLKR